MKTYNSPITVSTTVQLNTVLCASVGGGGSQGDARAQQRIDYLRI